MRAVGYVRVSTREQDEVVQIRAIEEFARERGMEVVKFYVDRGETGAKTFNEGPGARLLLEEIESVKPDCIVAWSIDRVGRTMLDTIQTIIGLEERGYRVMTVREEWLQTLDANIRRLVLSILSWVAEFERQRIRERQLEAWEAGKQRGRMVKVQDEVILKYLSRYNSLSISAVWKIMKSDGYNLSYDHLHRLKKLGVRKAILNALPPNI